VENIDHSKLKITDAGNHSAVHIPFGNGQKFGLMEEI